MSQLIPSNTSFRTNFRIVSGTVTTNNDDALIIYNQPGMLVLHQPPNGTFAFELRICNESDGTVGITGAWVKRETYQYLRPGEDLIIACYATGVWA